MATCAAPVPAAQVGTRRARVPRVHGARVFRRRALRAEPHRAAPPRTTGGADLVALVRHRRVEPRLALARPPWWADLPAGGVRRGDPVDDHRRGDRVTRRLLPRLARQPADAVHRPVDRASGAADPRGSRVDRHRRSRAVRDARHGRPARDHAPAVAAALGIDRTGGARRDVVAARARVHRRRPHDRRVQYTHHRAACAPELLRPDHGERHPRRRGSDPGGEHTLVPRLRHPAADTELGQSAVGLDRHPRGPMVAHRVPGTCDLPDRARGQLPR